MSEETDLEWLARVKAAVYYDREMNAVVFARRIGKYPVQPTRPTLLEAIAAARELYEAP